MRRKGTLGIGFVLFAIIVYAALTYAGFVPLPF